MQEPIAQVFVSYAQLDNAKYLGCPVGWVDRLYDALNIDLPTRGAHAKLWRDRRDLEPETYFDDTILDAVSRADVFLAILSPAYPQRAWCLKELSHFLSQAQLVQERGRQVLKVVKRPLGDPQASGLLPAELQGTGEFRFYSEDRQTGNVVLFIRPNGDIASDEFWDVIEQLGQAIMRAIDRAAAPRRAPAPSISVYLAEPSQDVRSSYRTLRAELMAQGYHVLPDPDQGIPDDYGEARDFVERQLSRCAMSIHLVGERSGFFPSPQGGESSAPITRLQLDLAKARCASLPSFRRFIWANRGLQPVQEDQRSLLRDLESGAALLSSDEFITEPLQLFKDAVLDHLFRSARLGSARGPQQPSPVLLVSHLADQVAADGLDAALHGADYESLPLSLKGPDGDARIDRLVGRVESVVVLFHVDDPLWARAVLGSLIKAANAAGHRPLLAVVFRAEEKSWATTFRSHYCDLVHVCETAAWDDAVGALSARLGRTPRK